MSTALLIPLALIYAFHRRVSLVSFLVAVLIGVGCLYLMNAWMQSRSLIRSGDLSQYSLWQQSAKFLPVFLDHLEPRRIGANDVQDLLQFRVDMTELLAAQRTHQPAYEPYAEGATFAGAFIGLVPRAVWPEKPVMAGGSGFVQKFTGIVRPEGDTTSIGLPYQFEFYANGGPWLVVIGLFAVGYVAGRAELGLIRNYGSLGKLWALIIVTLVICDGGQRFELTLPSLVAGALSAFAAGWVFERFLPELAGRMLGTQ